MDYFEYIGFLICLACTSGNLLASYRIKQLAEAQLERRVISCKPLCGDLKIMMHQTLLKGVCGLVNMSGFALSPPYVAAAGVGISSPLLMTRFLLKDKQDKIKLPLVFGSWFGFGLVLHMGYVHSGYQKRTISWEEWFGNDLSFKIAFFSGWALMALIMTRINESCKNTKFAGVIASISAYTWFSLSGGVSFVFGLMAHENSELATWGLVLIVPLLAFGGQFVKNIKIAEVRSCELIFAFAQLYFPASHAVFSYFFTGGYQEADDWADVALYFLPIVYLVGWAFFNVWINTKVRTELPPLFYMPSNMIEYSNDLRSQTMQEKDMQQITQTKTKTSIELVGQLGHPIWQKALRRDLAEKNSLSGTLSPINWSEDDDFEPYVI